MKLPKDALLRWTKFPVTALTLILAVGLGLTGCDDDDDNGDPGPGMDLSAVEAIQEEEDLATLAQSLTETGVEDDLQGEGPYTIFAPTDEAFEALPEGLLEGLSQEELSDILRYHVTASEVTSGDITEAQAIEAIQGDSLFLVPEDGQLVINRSATVTQPDLEVENGFIHKIDSVLLPDAYLDVYEIADKRYYTSLFACSCTSGRTGLQETLQDTSAEYTVFVPIDAAFEAIDDESLSDDELREVLEYHVVEGTTLSSELSDGQTLTTLNGQELTVSVADDGTVTLNDGSAMVLTADLEGINGVVHIIDAVLLPPTE